MFYGGWRVATLSLMFAGVCSVQKNKCHLSSLDVRVCETKHGSDITALTAIEKTIIFDNFEKDHPQGNKSKRMVKKNT